MPLEYNPIPLPGGDQKPDSTQSDLNALIAKYNKMFTDAGDNIMHQKDAFYMSCSDIVNLRDSAQDIFIEHFAENFKWLTKRDFTKRLTKIRKKNAEDENDNQVVDLPEVDKIENYLNEIFDIRFNVISNKYEFRLHDHGEFMEMNEYIIVRKLRKKYVNVSVSYIKEIIKSDYTDQYNPILEYFKKLPAWDGEDYIAKLCEYVLVFECDRERFNRQMKKMFVRIIAGALGIAVNKRSITFVGGQDAGKSTFIRWLCPKPLKDYYSEDVDFSDSKDGLRSLSENIFVNLDEIAHMPRNNINTIKGIMSKDTIKVRLPYDRNFTLMKRRCTFIASTNDEEFLTDPTGNVRWISFLLEGKGFNWNYKKDIDIDKVWAQAYYMLNNGFDYQLSKEELEENELCNMQFMVKTAEIELIPRFYEPAKPDDKKAEFWTATDFLEDLLKLYPGSKLNINIQSIGRALKLLKYNRVSKRLEKFGLPTWGYFVKRIPTAKNEKLVATYYNDDNNIKLN